MATFNSSTHTASVLNSSVAAAPLQLDAFMPSTAAAHFLTSTPTTGLTHATHQHQHHQQQHHHSQQQQAQQTNTTSSYTFVQIKREPCQVSEVTTSNNCNQSASAAATHHQQQHQHQHQHQQQHHHHGLVSGSSSISASKTMSATSTLTTLVKIEASSPKVSDMDKTSVVGTLNPPTVVNTNNSVPIGIAVARKRPQESTNTLGNAAALSMQQSLNKDMNCFGIRVSDLGGVGTNCSNIYFTGNGELMTGATTAATAEELALSAAGVQSVNRAPSTFWQYPSNALPIESVISMSPATVGLQYSREASRGQVVLLPATTTLDPFQQAAAAFVWPATAYIPQTGTAAPAAAAAAALQPPPNFIFPSMSPHSTLQPQSYATSLQLFGSNYLTAAAAAAAAAAASTTLCQHNQQTASQTTSSINLSLGGVGGSSTTSSCSTSSRFLSLATTTPGLVADTHKQLKHHLPATMAIPPITSISTAPPTAPVPPLMVPPATLKIEEWNATEFMAAAAKSTTTTLSHQHQLVAPVSVSMPMPVPMQVPTSVPVSATGLHFEPRDKASTTTTTTTTTNLLALQNNAQALNLVRLPTPPTSTTVGSAAMAAAPHLLFQAAPSPALLNLSTTATLPRTSGHVGTLPANTMSNATTNSFMTSASTQPTQLATATIGGTASGPLTPLGDDAPALNYKVTSFADSQPQIVVGVPRVAPNNSHQHSVAGGPAPQMQDVNIQTDTPVCSEDESSLCPLAIQQTHQTQPTQPMQSSCVAPHHADIYAAHDNDAQQPLELTRSSQSVAKASAQASEVEAHNECHSNASRAYNDGMPGTDMNGRFCSSAGATPGLATNTTAMTTTTAALPTPPLPSPCPVNAIVVSEASAVAVVPAFAPVQASPAPVQATPEDLTGLELLSNISTSSLAKSVSIRVKQEPIDHIDVSAKQEHMSQNTTSLNEALAHNELNVIRKMDTDAPLSQLCVPSHATEMPNEPLGGLNLLCALAEQRIQEEVQSNGSLFATVPTMGTENVPSMSTAATAAAMTATMASVVPTSTPCLSLTPSSTPTPMSSILQAQAVFSFQRQSPFGLDTAFPSMEGIELPTTSCLSGEAVKRKKHKHSKSSKSLSASNPALTKKSQRCGKKNKKSKNSKEKRKQQKLQLLQAEQNWDDEQLQDELSSAFSRVDASGYSAFGKWPNPKEIFHMMEANMRLRLADISRQYRRKKRKLDEISLKSKKKKKCSKLAAVAAAAAAASTAATTGQQLVLSGSSALTMGGVGGLCGNAASGCNATTVASTLCDYKFPNFSVPKSSNAAHSSAGGGRVVSHLHPSSFLRFGEKAQPQFPPPDLSSLGDTDVQQDLDDARNNSINGATGTVVYKPVRLEPSTLAAVDSRGLALRVGQKHTSEKSAQVIVCKESKLMSSPAAHSTISSRAYRRATDALGSCGDSGNSSPPLATAQSPQSQLQSQSDAPRHMPRPNPHDCALMISDEHLFRDETRVLTDMGGLFYAGVMKPLQPPDVYAITLDGERGNKSHIMSREEILKDTILEVAPKDVESVPVGTRLCAYWSQQYRCLYPGRAIESESSDDGSTTPDFVSVEFDDGDSGRIRLQNIRLLLSDYPIAEYNDNPLYSLGKQKKQSKSGTDSHSPASKMQYSCSLLEDPVSSDAATERLAIELQPTARELHVQRSEKKRMKSLKKKAAQNAAKESAAALANSSTVEANVSGGGVANGGSGENASAVSSDCNRKHHKHKKRKKHKKHHHRKLEGSDTSGLNGINGTNGISDANKMNDVNGISVGSDNNEASGGLGSGTAVVNHDDNTFTGTISTSKSTNRTLSQPLSASAFVSKREFENIMTTATVEDRHDDPVNVDGDCDADGDGAGDGLKLQRPHLQELDAARVKIESLERAAAVRIKSEHLELEEETTSNLMSEVSDENKAEDEVEHNNSKGSKIAAFLPDRQLWGWLGKAYRKAGVKGRARKQFYKTIKRGKETITVGDCAVFLSTGRPDRPYIGRIESMWETTSSNKVVRVRWFYHPEETTGCPNLRYPGALFESPHEDENDVQTISHRCEVLPFVGYFSKFGTDSKKYQSIYDDNDTYYLAGYYNPRLQVLNLQDDIPTLEEQTNHTSED